MLIVRKASLDVKGSHVRIQLSLTIVKTLKEVDEFSLWQAVNAVWLREVFGVFVQFSLWSDYLDVLKGINVNKASRYFLSELFESSLLQLVSQSFASFRVLELLSSKSTDIGIVSGSVRRISVFGV